MRIFNSSILFGKSLMAGLTVAAFLFFLSYAIKDLKGLVLPARAVLALAAGIGFMFVRKKVGKGQEDDDDRHDDDDDD